MGYYDEAPSRMNHDKESIFTCIGILQTCKISIDLANESPTQASEKFVYLL